MKVKKINNNKVVIIITLTELTKRNISLKDIKEGSENVQNLFFEILEDNRLTHEFIVDSTNMFVEVSTNGNDIFTITLTKADCIPVENYYNKLSQTDSILYTVSSNIYSFYSLEELYKFCKKALYENLYVGINSLYELNNKYFLMFSNSTIKKPNFVRTFSVISEYSDKYYAKQTTSFLEYANPIIPKCAIQTLQNI